MIRKNEPSLLIGELINANRELNILHSLKGFERPFRILRAFHLVDNGSEPEATIVLEAGGREIHEADTGVGPVDALANTLKKALNPAFPFLQDVKLIDFSARIFDSRSGTKTSVEVTVLLSDGEKVWTVSESSQNINQASFHALAAGYEFAILQRRRSWPKPEKSSPPGRKKRASRPGKKTRRS
jgi:2-isopropylmalate synthase